MANWLSNRVASVAGSLVVALDHAASASERALVASRLARARALGLVVVPGAYIPLEKGKGADDGDQEGEQVTLASAHLVHCSVCDLAYAPRHLHCCRCGRVFRSAWAFERHQGGSAHGCLSDAQLARRGLARRGDDGVWAGKPMAESTRKSLRRIA